MGRVAAIAGMTVLEGVRTRLVWLMVAVLLASVGLALFGGALAVMEVREIEAAILGFSLRLLAVLIMVLFVLNAQVREFNDKGMDLVLSLPIPRWGYFLGRLMGFSGIALMMALIFTVVAAMVAPWSQAVLWGISLFFELLMVIALALLSLFTFTQVPSAFTMVFALYVLARVVSTLQLVGHGPIMPTTTFNLWLMNRTIDGIAALLPDLDRFTRSEWLVYGGGGLEDLVFVVTQGSLYLILLSLAALIDLYRKNF